MADRIFVDTNILLYSISLDPADAAKRAIAERLLDEGDCALSVQVLQEFLHQATRATRPGRLAWDDAWDLTRTWRRFPVQENTLALLDNTHDLRRRTGYSLWDSLVVAAAQALGCTTLASEDMQDGRIIDGLRIVNPFK